MRPPTANPITQGQHGSYNAVDYGYVDETGRPNVYFYAPEDARVTAYLLNAGDAGNNLQMDGPAGRHGFCHCEEVYVTVGQQVAKGQRIGKMGYTGLTRPPGPDGRHLHWVIRRPDGTYVYPPSLITEPFGSGGNMKATREEVIYIYKTVLGMPPTEEQIASQMAANTPFEVLKSIAGELDEQRRGQEANIRQVVGVADARYKQQEQIVQALGIDADPDDVMGIVEAITRLRSAGGGTSPTKDQLAGERLIKQLREVL